MKALGTRFFEIDTEGMDFAGFTFFQMSNKHRVILIMIGLTIVNSITDHEKGLEVGEGDPTHRWGAQSGFLNEDRTKLSSISSMPVP